MCKPLQIRWKLRSKWGKNVTIDLFSFMMLLLWRHVSFLGICPCLCDGYLSFCICLSLLVIVSSFVCVCVNEKSQMKAPNTHIVYTPCQTSHLLSDWQASRKPRRPFQNKWESASRGRLSMFRLRRSSQKGPRYLLCSDCAHRRSSGLPLG